MIESFLASLCQTYPRKAKVARARAEDTADPYLRFAWEQIAGSYDQIAKRCLEIQARISDRDGLYAREVTQHSTSILITATVCEDQSERMRALARIETDETKQRDMRAISDHYCLLRDDLMALQRLILPQSPRPPE